MLTQHLGLLSTSGPLAIRTSVLTHSSARRLTTAAKPKLYSVGQTRLTNPSHNPVMRFRHDRAGSALYKYPPSLSSTTVIFNNHSASWTRLPSSASFIPPRRNFSSSSSRMVQEIKSLEQFKTLIAGEKPVIIDFWATWCGPCKVISPIFAKMADQFPTIEFAKVDVDEQSEIAQELSIRAMPTFILFKNGEKAGECVGANPAALNTLVETHK